MKVGQGVWFYPGKLPALVTNVINDDLLDLVVDEDGSVFGRGNVPLGPGPGEYFLVPEEDDLPDVDQIMADERYRLYPGDESNQPSNDDQSQAADAPSGGGDEGHSGGNGGGDHGGGSGGEGHGGGESGEGHGEGGGKDK